MADRLAVGGCLQTAGPGALELQQSLETSSDLCCGGNTVHIESIAGTIQDVLAALATDSIGC